MRFLIIDDSPYDRELIIRKLRDEFSDATFVEIGRQADFEEAMAQTDFDAVLVDYGLKWTNGLEILKKHRARFPDLPIVMVTDTGSEEVAAEGMKAGLSDYVLKRHLQRLPFAVKESLEKAKLLKERKLLEEQVQQAQKMESLGLLVGGVAHDFNNMLAGITGYAQLGLSLVKPDDPLYDHLNHIHEIAKRATTMTRHLLAFSRRQALEPSDVNLNLVISNLLDFLGKILAKGIVLDFVGDPMLKTIYVDAIQIEQVVMNLCINASDAMPEGGKIIIKTQNMLLDEINAKSYQNVQPGSYVLLTVADTGVGMDKQVRERIFEPFFTTKEVGKGTGLGLSVVHGVIAQHNGFIAVDSEMGKGTTFNIYFPAVDRMDLPVETGGTKVAQEGTETILVVEDDPDLRWLMEKFLQNYGYCVILAHDGEEGLKLFEQHAPSIALVIADLMMPKMKGRELYEHIRRLSPTAKVLFVSGYRADQLGQDFVVEKGVEFLEKPFDLDNLVVIIRKLLV
jgi:two-component system cell cycle sensor histidine kinase/response regulator CckA